MSKECGWVRPSFGKQAYFAAVASGRWPKQGYLLSDQREFFAMTASTLLIGEVARPPYTRRQLQAAMPEYCTWLSSQLGGSRAR